MTHSLTVHTKEDHFLKWNTDRVDYVKLITLYCDVCTSKSVLVKRITSLNITHFKLLLLFVALF